MVQHEYAFKKIVFIACKKCDGEMWNHYIDEDESNIAIVIKNDDTEKICFTNVSRYTLLSYFEIREKGEEK